MLERLLKKEIKIHNKREEDLVYCININIENWIEAYKKGYDFTCKSDIEKINGLLSALFYLDMIKEPAFIYNTDIIELIEK